MFIVTGFLGKHGMTYHWLTLKVLQRVPAWILWLLLFRGIVRDYCKDLSYDVCNNIKWLTIQEATFVSVLVEKLVDSELVRKCTVFHGTRNWLPCYCVTMLPRAHKRFLSWYRLIYWQHLFYYYKLHCNIILPFTPLSTKWILSLIFLLHSSECIP